MRNLWWPKDKRADKTKEGVGTSGKTRPLSPFPPPCVTTKETVSPASPPTPQGGGICPTLPPPSIPASSSQQMTCKTPSHSLYTGYKSGPRTPFNVGSPLSWPAVLTASPTLINFISLLFLYFCLVSGNSFPTHTWTTTSISLKITYQDEETKEGSKKEQTKNRFQCYYKVPADLW